MDKPAKYCAILGMFFLILYTAYASFSTIITQIHEQDGLAALGPSLLAVSNAAYLLGNIFSPSFTWKYKKQMAFAAIGFSINFSTGLLLGFLPNAMKYFVTLSGAAIAGFGSAALWTSLGGYIHMVCQKFNIVEQKGKYFGIFSVVYCIHNIPGALITTFGLGLFSVNIYFAIIGSIGLLSSLFCFLLVKDIQEAKGMRITEKFSAVRSARNLFIFYPKVRHLLPLIFGEGLIIGFITTSLTHLIPKSESDHEANIRAGIAFLCLGVGAIISSYFTGIICDYCSLKVSVYLNSISFTLLIGGSLYGVYLEDYYYACFLFFCWGITLYYFETFLRVICSKFYDGRLESFAICKQFQSISVIIYAVVSISTSNTISLYYILPSLLIFVIPMVFSSLRMIKRHERGLFTAKIIIGQLLLKQETEHSLFSADQV